MNLKFKSVSFIISLLLTASAFAANQYDFNIINGTFTDMELYYSDFSGVKKLDYGTTTILQDELLIICQYTPGNCQFEIDADETRSIATIVLNLKRGDMWILPHSQRYGVSGSATKDGFTVQIHKK